jgi:hypothetical protein
MASSFVRCWPKGQLDDHKLFEKVVPDHDSKMKVAGRKHAADANGAKTKPVIKLVTMLSGSLASIGREVLNRISQKTGARAVPKKAVLTCPANASP